MQARTLLPATALIALIAGGPLAWAQDSHDTKPAPSTSNTTKAGAEAQNNTPDNGAVAMTAGQSTTVCNDRNNTVPCGAKTIPHEPEPSVPPVNPAAQAPAPAQ